jgi:protein phosphatase
MASKVIKIQCVNNRCKTFNALEEHFCSRCHTPLAKRYLWTLGKIPAQYKLGDLIQERFYYYAEKILLDTQPHLVPPLPPTSTIPEAITPYLKLFSHRLNLPQIYGCIPAEDYLWLLEYESIPLTEKGELIYPQLFPTLEEGLTEASPLRQLNWLGQITQLWQPLSQQKVLSSLFQANNIRVQGGVIKLRELHIDDNLSPTLVDLGNLWSNWLNKIDFSLQEILRKIVYSLQQQLINEPQHLLEIIDQILYILGINYYQRKYQIITATDPGRKRKKNEDNCYPEPGIKKENRAGIDTLTIVCDGLGGQKAGEIASDLAIKILQKELNKSYQQNFKETLYNKHWTPLIDDDKILSAVAKANDKITGFNNVQKRKDRARMGTTVVMSMALDHEVYLAHIGDSRIYLITADSCHQLTIDDDLASREVCLGYAFYREISKNPQTGSLIQALGMESSSKIKPHIQRLVVDEDCIFLLCSDGLSDFDRVEQYWQTHISPVVQKNVEIEIALKNLLDVGVRKNGHDNITIALVYCQLTKRDKPLEENLSWQYLQEILPNLPEPEERLNSVSKSKLQLHKQLKNKPVVIVLISLISLLLGLLIWHQLKSENEQKNSLKSNLIRVK